MFTLWTFSGLVKAVREFWDFVWPAIVCLTILLAVIRGVAPTTFARIITRLAALYPSPSSQVSAYRSFKRFGFDKIVPIFTAFLLLFLMNVAKSMVVSIGDTLPPRITYNYQLWLLDHVSNNRLACLWAHFDDAPHFYEMQNDLERAVSEIEGTHKDASPVESLHNWRDNSGVAQTAFDACKFFIVWTLAWTLIESFAQKRFLTLLEEMLSQWHPEMVLIQLTDSLFQQVLRDCHSARRGDAAVCRVGE